MTATDVASIEAALARLDESIDSLASTGDLAALETLLADDFVYSHSTGHVQNKGEWLDSLKPLVGRRNRVASGIKVELHGDVAITKGDLDIVWLDAPTKYNRYLRTFRLTSGRWQAISQTTLPAPEREPRAT
ncbi:MAG TPA: nuclear transport factor 2 family protein [Dehalococcoidia bacterium]|nr:nuclear transport factor 2 family protein [Dehalococcoidia bacterium]